MNTTVLRWVAVLLPPVLLGAFEFARLPQTVLVVVAAFLALGPVIVIRGFDAFLTWLVGILLVVYIVMFIVGEVATQRLGFIGSAAFVAACAITALATYRRAGIATLPGGLVQLLGAFLFLNSRLALPLGALAQLLLAVGWAGMLLALRRQIE